MENYSDFVRCFICSENMKDARILPCLHSFCFECLKSEFNKEISNKVNELNCPICDALFELPKRGLENLKKNEFIEYRTATVKINCGTCSKLEITNFCLNCKLYLCSSCTSVHQRIPKTKDDVLSKINLSRKSDIEASYCKSCLKWVDCEKLPDHNSCKLNTFSEFKEDFDKKLQQEITKTNLYIDAIKVNLTAIIEHRSSLIGEAENLKDQVQQHCEQMKHEFDKYIDSCNEEINKEIDDKIIKFEEKLSLHLKDLLKLSTELEEKTNKYKNMPRQFDPVTFAESIENDTDEVFEHDEIISIKDQTLFLEFLKEKLKLIFVPNLLHGNFFTSQISIGNLRPSDDIQPQLIKTIYRVHCYQDNLSVTKTNLFLGYPSRENIYKIDIYCGKNYDHLSSVELKIPYYEWNLKLIDNFLFALKNTADSSLDIYNLEKQKYSPDWKKTIELGFNGKRIIRSSRANLFILGAEKKKIIETTLDGEITHVIKIPKCFNDDDIDGFVHLKNNRFAISSQSKLCLINCNGDVIKQIDSGTSGIMKPYGLITDKHLNLFVGDCDNQKIHVLDFSLNFLRSFNAQCYPYELCFNSTQNRLVVVCLSQIKVFQL